MQTIIALKNCKIKSLLDDIQKKDKELEKYKAKENLTMTMENDTDKKVISDLSKLLHGQAHLRSLTGAISNGTIRGRFTNISKLTNTYVYSPSTMIAGMRWSIAIGTHIVDSKKYLQVHLSTNAMPIPP
ncbi:hypothetical protein PFISCL1PPCAC_22170 [Pristionchus fissidentatus]|uniref:Ribosomal protein n=1 Tax=Pristionchus fissidentatus TaxID=1538716 RepID=A0AAV5WHD5_9BILA|nr:hypothetical protein PFISCL1PPCAC_22170 [Pristionchus fissidentatus]